MQLTEFLTHQLSAQPFRDAHVPFYPPTIEIEQTLADVFVKIRDTSEREVYEYGCRIFYHQSGRVYCGDIIRGAATFVEIPESRHAKLEHILPHGHSVMIGDFHVHPYARKLDPTASVGPSYGDYESWIAGHKKILANSTMDSHEIKLNYVFEFVFAARRLYCVVMHKNSLRRNFATVESERTRYNRALEAHFDFTTQDARYREKLKDYQGRSQIYKTLFRSSPPEAPRDYAIEEQTRHLGEAINLESRGRHEEAIRKERETYEMYKRLGFDRAVVFSECAHQFNIDVANACDFGLYIATQESGFTNFIKISRL